MSPERRRDHRIRAEERTAERVVDPPAHVDVAEILVLLSPGKAVALAGGRTGRDVLDGVLGLDRIPVRLETLPREHRARHELDRAQPVAVEVAFLDLITEVVPL